MSALEKAKQLSCEDVLLRLETWNLHEFGAYHEKVAEKWKTAMKEKGYATCVVAGLNNCDTNHILWKLVERDPAKIFEGLLIAAYATKADVIRLYIPEEIIMTDLEELAKKYHVELIPGIVNVQENKGGIIHHIETVLAIAEILDESYESGVWIAVKHNNEITDLKKVPFGTKISEIKETAEVSLKGVVIGTDLYSTEVLDEYLTEDNQPSNGVIEMLSDKCCIIDETKKILLENRKQSCGKCLFCREGLVQLHTMEKEITEGNGKQTYVDMLQEIGAAMTISTPCSMGQNGAKFVLDSLKIFTDEYENHIKKKKCENHVCSAFMSIYIDPVLCDGCEECVDVCPVGAIEGKAGFIHMIDEFECTKCGKCIAECEQDAIIQTSDRVPKLPDKLTKCGKFKKKR